jgi:hypothetical protein
MFPGRDKDPPVLLKYQGPSDKNLAPPGQGGYLIPTDPFRGILSGIKKLRISAAFRHGQHIDLSPRKGHGDGKIFAPDPKGMTIGNRFHPPDKTVDPVFVLPVKGIVQKGPEPEFVKTSPESPPDMTAYKGPGYGNQAVPEDRQGDDYW